MKFLLWGLRKTAPAALQFLAVLFALSSSLRLAGTILRKPPVDWISTRPQAGDVIVGTGGLRKVRYGRAGSGKRSGARVIYFFRSQLGEIALVVVYAKAKLDNLPAHVLLQWKEALDAQT